MESPVDTDGWLLLFCEDGLRDDILVSARRFLRVNGNGGEVGVTLTSMRSMG